MKTANIVDIEKNRLEAMERRWAEIGLPVSEVCAIPAFNNRGTLKHLSDSGMQWRDIELFANRNGLAVPDLMEAYDVDFFHVERILETANQIIDSIPKPGPNMNAVRYAVETLCSKKIEKDKSVFSGAEIAPAPKKIVSKIRKSCPGFYHPHFHP